MNRYELIAIVKTELAEEDITAIMDRSQAIITERSGVIAKIEKWGKRRLAYEINKQKDGFYFFIDFSGDGPMVAEVERNYKIDDRILKFMTVRKKARSPEKESMRNLPRRKPNKRRSGSKAILPGLEKMRNRPAKSG